MLAASAVLAVTAAARDCSVDAAHNASCIISTLRAYVAQLPSERTLPVSRRKTALYVGAKQAMRAAQTRERLGLKPASGLWLEFGAYGGGSTRTIANFAENAPGALPVYSFDSFLGLPETWRPAPDFGEARRGQRASTAALFLSAGSFSRHGQPPYNDSRIVWQVGWFNETLAPFLAAHTPSPSLSSSATAETARRMHNVTFLHIDSDLYSSADTVLRLLESRLAPGVMIVFDELVNYPEFLEGEMRALLELQRRSGRTVRIVHTAAVKVLRTKMDNLLVLKKQGAEMPHGRLQQSVAIELL